MDTIISRNSEETFAVAAQFASRLHAGDVVALSGGLGAGKTHFVKGLARALGFEGDVTSPTFTLVHEYVGGRVTVFHIDLYRIVSVEEAVRAGIEDYLEGGGVTVVEWADKLPELIPSGAHRLHFESRSSCERVITIS